MLNRDEMAEDIKLVRAISFMSPTKYEINSKSTKVKEYTNDVLCTVKGWLEILEGIDSLENIMLDEVAKLSRVVVDKTETNAGEYELILSDDNEALTIEKALEECVQNITLDKDCYVKTEGWKLEEAQLIFVTLRTRIKGRVLRDVANKNCADIQRMVQSGELEVSIISSICREMRSVITWLIHSAQIDTARRASERLVGIANFEEKIKLIESMGVV